jgi:hypothetical protein
MTGFAGFVTRYTLLYIAIYAARRLLWYNNARWEKFLPAKTCRAHVRLSIIFGGLCAIVSCAASVWGVYFPGREFAGWSFEPDALAQFTYWCAAAGVLIFGSAGRAVDRMYGFVQRERTKQAEALLVKRYGLGPQQQGFCVKGDNRGGDSKGDR